MVVVQEFVDLETPTGVMRTHVIRPAGKDAFRECFFIRRFFR